MKRLLPENVLWEIVDAVAQKTEEDALTKSEVREVAKAMIAERWKVPVEQITQEDDSTLYTILSKVIRLVFPVSNFAAANLGRERARGKLGFNDALEIARGNAVGIAELDAHRGQTTSPRKAGIDLLAAIRFIVTQGREVGYTDTELMAIFEEVISSDAAIS